MSYPNRDNDFIDGEHLDNRRSFDIRQRLDIRKKLPSGWRLGALIVGSIMGLIVLGSIIFGGGGGASHKTQPAPKTIVVDAKTGTSKVKSSTQTTIKVSTAATNAIHGGLDSWATYVTNGMRTGLDTYFVKNGNQYKAITSSTARFPLTFVDRKITIESKSITSNSVTAHVIFTAKRDGAADVHYDTTMTVTKNASGNWQIATVVQK